MALDGIDQLCLWSYINNMSEQQLKDLRDHLNERLK